MSAITSSTAPLQVDAKIRTLLGALRWRVRGYVLIEGVAIVLVWCAVTFCVGWAVDYLPVLLGANEMPRFARAAWLACMILGGLYLVYRYLFQRLFVPLPDRSLALLVERKYEDLQESLVTIVELSGRPFDSPATAEMLSVAHAQATASLNRIQLRSLFNMTPLISWLAGLLMFAALLTGAFVWQRAGLVLAAERLYLLHEEPWPRFARIAMESVEVRRPSHESAGIPPQFLTFENKVLKVARGSHLTLKVKADAKASVVPQYCVLHYRSSDGDNGSVTLKSLGRPQEGFQLYACDTKPLSGILSSLDFDVLGYDHRLRGYRVEVVDSPAITAVRMDVTFPQYMVDEQNAIRLPRQDEPVTTSNNSLPQGSQVVLRLQTNKPLLSADVRLVNPLAAEAATSVVHSTSLTFNAENQVQAFDFPLPVLLENRTVEILLHDTDSVLSERWFRIFFTALPDEAPRWEFTLRGIGTEVTPDVEIPVAGRATDDYGIARTWLDTKLGELPREFSLNLAAAGMLNTTLDFRRLRADDSGLALKPGMKLTLLARAQDFYNLADKPNVGVSEQFTLEVVTAEKLLAGLEAREIALRRRLEQIISELNDSRDSLLRVRAGEIEIPEKAAETLDPEGSTTNKLTPEQQLAREKELRLLRVQRALQQVRKSWQEVAGVADSFDLIREELINNRVDTQERKERLQELIATPLHRTTENEFPALENKLLELEPALENAKVGTPLAEQTIRQSNELIANLEQILQKMLKLESYNEILDLVRTILREQQSIREETKREQKRELEE